MVQPHIEFCNACKKYVRLDQTREECAVEQQCDAKHCPLDKYFHYSSEPKGDDVKPPEDAPTRK